MVLIRSARTGSAAFVDVYREVERAKSKILHACRLLTCARNSTQSRFLQELELLGIRVLQGFVFERDIRHHLLEAGFFFFKLPHLFDVGNVHAAEFRFPSGRRTDD